MIYYIMLLNITYNDIFHQATNVFIPDKKHNTRINAKHNTSYNIMKHNHCCYIDLNN